jgi:hypothetical protein
MRGKAGWGENTAFITTVANSFGARWFDENWKPQFDQPAWKEAMQFYVDLQKEADLRALLRTASTKIWRCSTPANAPCGSTPPVAASS